MLVAMADIVRELGLKGLFRGTVRLTERHMQHRDRERQSTYTRQSGLCHLVCIVLRPPIGPVLSLKVLPVLCYSVVMGVSRRPASCTWV